MAKKIALVTDSLSDLVPEIVERFKVTVVPIRIIFGDEVYRDRVDITDEQFYEKLRTSDVLPKTSQPTPNEFEEVYTKLLKEYDHVISLHISIKLSGTVQSAALARQSFSKSDQERIHVIDTLTGAMGEGLMVHAAGVAIESGKQIDEVLKVVNDAIASSGIIWIPGSLKYLVKNGRIGGASALIGGILHILPLLGCKESVYTIDKIRGIKNAVPRFMEYMKKTINPAATLVACIINNNMPKEAAELEKALMANFKVSKLFKSGMGAGIGSHIGPDTFGVAWYSAN